MPSVFNVQEVWTDQYLSNLLPVEALCQGMDAIQALYRILLVTLVKAQGLQSLLNTYRGTVQCTVYTDPSTTTARTTHIVCTQRSLFSLGKSVSTPANFKRSIIFWLNLAKFSRN